jgi:hypothetical protein
MHLRSYFRFASCALGILCCWGATAARAASISVTYSLSGTATGDPANPPLMGNATGSLLPFGSITWSDLLFPDPATSSGNGTFTITFTNGDTLVGALHEHLDFTAPPDAVPFTQTIVVTGGTGAFAGFIGVLNGDGTGNFLTSMFSTSGSGTLNTIPEPASIALLPTGLLCILAYRRHARTRRRL